MFEFLDYRVQDVMNPPVTVGPDATLAEVEALLEKHGFNAVPVVDSAERLLGLVTSLDLLRPFDFPEETILPPYEQVLQRPVADVMTRDVLTVCPRTPVQRVVEKIVATRNKSFPVVDSDRVVGVVARQDVMLALRQATAGRKPLQRGVS